MNENVKISLVGAGPGDIDLITVKGLKAIQTADVILYDALVNEELLAEAPDHCVKLFVGKRAGVKCIKQEEINLLLVQSALRHGHAVRLKGGDPFIFGEVNEEMIYAEAFDIPVEVVPGISSAISLPLLQGVPLTRRNVSESFWVLTGSTKDHKLSQDIVQATKTTATLVILMGIRKLPLIAQLLINEGKEETPIMIIQKGSTPEEKIVVGTAKDIVKLAKEEKISTPGISSIGEVVGLHPKSVTQK